MSAMPRRSKLNLKPLNLGEETIGQRLTRLRKDKGYTQVELAKKMGLIQAIVSAYERDKLRPHSEMIVRFAQALELATDEILGLDRAPNNNYKFSLKLTRRMIKIEALPNSQQKTLLRTIDAYLKGIKVK
jgi:transcriptional regulator with XRE-family HTH domain